MLRSMSDVVFITAYEDLDHSIRFREEDEDGVFLNWLDIYALTNSGAGAMWGTVKADYTGPALIQLVVTVATVPAPAGNPGYVAFTATAAETGLLQDPVAGDPIESGKLDLWFNVAQVGHKDFGDDKRLGVFDWTLSKSVSVASP
jgi:hypothetical protein